MAGLQGLVDGLLKGLMTASIQERGGYGAGRSMEMMFLVLAVLVTVTTVATVALAGSRSHRKNDPDATFWYVFTGMCVVAPMILIPAMSNRVLSCALLLLAAGTAVATQLWCRRHADLLAATGHQAELAAAFTQISHRHQALITQWSRYELDPGAAIDFPTMSDVRVPETSALIRAVTAANQLQPVTDARIVPDTVHSAFSLMTDDGVATYQRAVAELEVALETAEAAARRYQRG